MELFFPNKLDLYAIESNLAQRKLFWIKKFYDLQVLHILGKYLFCAVLSLGFYSLRMLRDGAKKFTCMFSKLSAESPVSNEL